MSKAERIMFRIGKGAMIPADKFSIDRLRERGYKIGDLVSADIRKARNPKFHRMVHVLGKLLVENLESFEGLDAHGALKRLQWEGNIACDEMQVNVPNIGMVSVRIPGSLSFENMDEGEFQEVYKRFCETVRKTYWPQLDEGAIEEMARLAGDAG